MAVVKVDPEAAKVRICFNVRKARTDLPADARARLSGPTARARLHATGGTMGSRTPAKLCGRLRGPRPEWTDFKVAQLRFDPSESTWSLYCRDRNERWSVYDEVGSAPTVDPLLNEIDEDPTGIFWG